MMAEDRATVYEYQKRTRLGLLLWFLRRNFLNLFTRFLLVGLVFWLCVFGGVPFLILRWIDGTKKIQRSNSVSIVQKSSSSSASSAPAVASDLGQGGDSSSVPEGSLKDFTEEQQKRDSFFLPYRPALFYSGRCFLRNGLEITVGYTFEKGTPYAGKKVSRIDHQGRFFVLDGALTVSMF